MRTRVNARRVKAAADNSGDPINTGGGVRVDHALRDIVRSLDEASSNEDIAKSLSLLGSLFQMPHVYLVPRKGDERGQTKAFLGAAPGMRRAASALAELSLSNVFGKANGPISLSDVARSLGPSWNRPLELRGLEAVATTVEVSPDSALHVIFFGKGVASGLSKSLLFLGTYLAAHRRVAASRRPDALRALTERERQVLNLAKNGLTDAKIGKMLGIATRTVRFHLGNAMRKAGAQTRAQLIAKSSQRTLK